MVRKPGGFYKDMNKEQWLSYGKERGFDKLSRDSLRINESAYHNKGRKEGWLAELIPKTLRKPSGFYKKMTKEGWLNYGRENALDRLSRKELEQKQGSYYNIGCKQGWIADLIPETKQKQKGFFKYMNKEQWLSYGKERGFDKLSRDSLRIKESAYHNKGRIENWLAELIPEIKHKPNGFYKNMNKEQWLTYGIENGYDKLSRTELQKEQGKYYQKGGIEGWVKELILETEQKPNGFYKNMTKEQWIAYGRENGLNKLNRSNLWKKENKYCQKGNNEGWLDELIPNAHNSNSLESAVQDYLEEAK
jgi:hypothetical protein